MKLSEIAIDVDAQENGAWVEKIPEMEGLRLKVRGANNSDWRKLQSRLVNATPRKKRIGGLLDTVDQDRINALVIRDAGLLDWDGIDGADGKPIPYSKEMAEKLLTDPQYSKFRDAVLWACTVVAEQENSDRGTDAKN